MSKQPNRSGGRLWGPRRTDAGISLNELHAATGIAKGTLSMMEHGRFIPTPEEQTKVEAELEKLIAARAAAQAPA